MSRNTLRPIPAWNYNPFAMSIFSLWRRTPLRVIFRHRAILVVLNPSRDSRKTSAPRGVSFMLCLEQSIISPIQRIISIVVCTENFLRIRERCRCMSLRDVRSSRAIFFWSYTFHQQIDNILFFLGQELQHNFSLLMAKTDSKGLNLV